MNVRNARMTCIVNGGSNSKLLSGVHYTYNMLAVVYRGV